MSGGQKISDHSFWAGGKPSGSVLPNGAKMKTVKSTEGAGAEMDYEDTNDKLVAQQNAGVAKIKAHPTKALYRN